MTRDNKFASSGGPKETPAGKLMETIVEDVITANTMSFAQWHALSANPLVPLAIPVSQGGEYRVTQAGVDAAHLLSQQSWKSREALRQTIDREAFMKLSFQAIGDTLRDSQSRLPTVPDGQNEHDVLLGDDFYAELAADYQARLQQLAASASPDVGRHIPCHLFHSDQAVPAFAVGPVRFLPRAEWLDSFVKNSEVRELIRQVEARELDMEELPARLKTSSPRYVVCAGPSGPAVTLLIENPRAFENAVRSGLGETVALVCTYGFGLSYLGQAWVEDMHSEDKPIQIIRSGTPGSLSTLLQAKQIYLWADLDLAALSIYRSLKSTIPQLQFSAIYQVMMEMAKDGKRSHPYAAIFEKDGQVANSASMVDVSDPVVKVLFDSCWTRAVDQEAVLETDILLLGKSRLKIDTEA